MPTANRLLIVAILAFGAWGAWEHARFLSVKAEYSDFRQEATAQVLKQEKAHNDQINAALIERDASIARMRDSQTRSKSLQSSLATALSRGTCQDSATDHAALSRFFTDLEGYIVEADTAVINVKAWLESWPKKAP